MVVHLGVLSNFSYGSTLKNQYGRHFQNGRHEYIFLLAFYITAIISMLEFRKFTQLMPDNYLDRCNDQS
jgi:hypothetical protein